MSATRDSRDVVARLESALDDLVQALERDRRPAPPAVDQPPAAWPADPPARTGPRRLTPIPLPRARV